MTDLLHLDQIDQLQIHLIKNMDTHASLTVLSVIILG